MTLLTTSLILWLAAAAGETAPTVIQAPDSPVRVDHAKIFNVVAGRTRRPDVRGDEHDRRRPRAIYGTGVFLRCRRDAEGETDRARAAYSGKAHHQVLDHGPRRLGAESYRSRCVRHQPGAADRLGQVVVGRARRLSDRDGQETVTSNRSREHYGVTPVCCSWTLSAASDHQGTPQARRARFPWRRDRTRPPVRASAGRRVRPCPFRWH